MALKSFRQKNFVKILPQEVSGFAGKKKWVGLMQTLVPSGVNSLLLRRQTVCTTALISPLTLLWIISIAWPKVYWPIINCKKIMSPISDWIVWLYVYSSCSDISLWSRAPCMISINHCITMIQDIISIEPNDILNKMNLSGVVDYLFFYCKKLVSFRLSFQKIWPWPILHIGQQNKIEELNNYIIK